MARESAFQADLIRDLRDLFDGCIILKNDANYLQGVPDLLILFGDKWAALECKASMDARLQPNQAYYIVEMNAMSYASVICPENKENVLDELQQTFRVGR